MDIHKELTSKELDFISKQGEGLFSEFKESFEKSLVKEIVAFSNAVGGQIGGQEKKYNQAYWLK